MDASGASENLLAQLSCLIRQGESIIASTEVSVVEPEGDPVEIEFLGSKAHRVETVDSTAFTEWATLCWLSLSRDLPSTFPQRQELLSDFHNLSPSLDTLRDLVARLKGIRRFVEMGD